MTDLQEIKEAMKEAAKHKTKRMDVQRVLADIDKYALILQKIVMEESFVQRKTKECIIVDGSNKKTRTIYKPKYFPDLCMQHLVVRQLERTVLKGQYFYSHGSVKGKGLKLSIKTIAKWLNKDNRNTKYCLKLDVRHFYENISHDALFKRLEKYIKDTRFLNLIKTIVNPYKGLPLGFYTSPALANFLMTEIDNLIKHELKAKYYLRYLDDMFIFGANKKKLHKTYWILRDRLRNVGLWFKKTWQVFKLCKLGRNGKGRVLQALGFRFVFYGKVRIILKKRCLYVLTRCARRFKLKKLERKRITTHEACEMMSRFGVLKIADVYGFYEKYFKGYVSKRTLRKIISKKGSALCKRELLNQASIRSFLDTQAISA